jgi:hypothetical protein
MKKRICVLLGILLLTLVLAVPASASKPTEVSGAMQFVPPPQNRVWRPAGNNCFVEIDATHTWTGDLVGTSVTHWRIVSHGPCEENGPVPYKYHETINVKGTFTGMVAGKSGAFGFTGTAENWPTGTGDPNITIRLVILSGASDLANLHGVLDVDASDNYLGKIHFDPQP